MYNIISRKIVSSRGGNVIHQIHIHPIHLLYNLSNLIVPDQKVTASVVLYGGGMRQLITGTVGGVLADTSTLKSVRDQNEGLERG